MLKYDLQVGVVELVEAGEIIAEIETDKAIMEVEAVDEGLKQARKNVGADTCWDGYKAKGTKKKRPVYL